MKKLLLTLIAVQFALLASSQQPFSVKLTRPAKGVGKNARISLIYQGEVKTILKKNSEFILTGTLPADSVIQLTFKRPMDWPNKYFLYPNSTLNYNLEVKLGMIGLIKINDNSFYPAATSANTNIQSGKGLLPKGVSINKRTLGVSYINEKTLSSDKIREQWTRKGGKIIGRSISYNFTFASMTLKDPPTKTKIFGGGYVYSQNHYNLKIPEYKTGLATWKSFVYGMGGSVNLHMSQINIDMAPPAKDIEASGGAFVFMLTGNAGYTLGVGKFRTETVYKGVAIDLTYKPSVIATLSEGGNQVQLNMKGFGVDISRTSFSAFANSLAPKAKSRFSFFFLPPLKNTPLMVTFGYGLVWYR